MIKLSVKSIIAPEKLVQYLLFPRKRNDKSKWLAQAGYKLDNWQILERDLRNQILARDAIPIEKSQFGQMYEIRGMLVGPNGVALNVCSIWMRENQTQITKFVTMYPDKVGE